MGPGFESLKVHHSESCLVSVFIVQGPPVPIPNTEVKLTCAENTWLEAAWENRSSPTFLLFCFMSIVNMKRPCESTVMVEHKVFVFFNNQLIDKSRNIIFT